MGVDEFSILARNVRKKIKLSPNESFELNPKINNLILFNSEFMKDIDAIT